MTILIYLVALSFLSELYLGDIDIGPVSLRSYLLPLLLICITGHSIVSRQQILRSENSQKLAFVYGLFVLWVFFSRLYNDESVLDVVSGVVGKYLFGVGNFLVIQYLLRENIDIEKFGRLMLFTAVLSAFMGILQWLGVNWAWDIALTLRPGEENREQILGIVNGRSGGFVPGLASYSIPFSYQIICYGLFIVPWLNEKRTNLVVGIIFLGVIFFATVISQSQSALLVIFISPILYFWLRRRLGIKEMSLIRKTAVPALFILSAVILFFMTVNQSNYNDVYDVRPGPGEGKYSLARIFNLNDPHREGLVSDAFRIGLENPLTGISRKNYYLELRNSNIFGVYGRPTIPHNLFLNAFVFYGVPGVVMILLLLWVILSTCWDAVQKINLESGCEWIPFGAILGIFAYFLNGNFHNDNFAMGGTIPWWFLGVLCAWSNIFRDEKSLKNIHKFDPNFRKQYT